MSNKLIVLSAPSGAGKSTLANLILTRNKDRFVLSISATTRPPRGDEKDSIHYFFKTESEFKSMINRNEFLEYAHVFGHAYYGTPIQYVKSKLDEGFNVLFDIDVQGAKQIKQKYQSQCVTIFINAPSFDELEKRLTNRKTDSVESIQKRLMTAKKEIAEAATFDYTIINKDIEDSYQQLISIFEKESCL